MGGSPKMPPPQPMPRIRSVADPAIADALEKERLRTRSQFGFRSTILSGPMGVPMARGTGSAPMGGSVGSSPSMAYGQATRNA